MERHLKTAQITRSPRVYDHELDMAREAGEGGSLAGRIWNLFRKTFSPGSLTVAPMRSVAREAEESWPIRDS